MKKIALIVAKASNNQIGKNNDLLWHLPKDMAFFKAVTRDAIVLTGRKNYESIPEKYRPLPGRENWVLTRDVAYKADGAVLFHSLQEALTFYQNYATDKTLFIIGGGQIYTEALALNCVDEMYITEVNVALDGDTVFPSFDQNLWEEEIMEEHLKDEKHSFDFTMKHYTKK